MVGFQHKSQQWMEAKLMIESPQLNLCISIVSRALILARRKLILEQDKSTYAILAATLKTTFVAVELQKRRKNCECCPVSLMIVM